MDTKVTPISQLFYSGSGAAASRPAANTKPNGSIWYSTDTKDVDQVQSGSWVTIIDYSAIGYIAIIGDLLETSADTARSSVDDTYTKYKEIKIARPGVYRIKFDIKTSQAGTLAYGKIYKNGVAVGTEQTDTTGGYVTKSEDISGWSAGDLCQLYLHRVAPRSSDIQNFRIYSDNPIINAVITD